MANTYTWKVEHLDCLPSSENKNKVVNIIHWAVTGFDDTNAITIRGAQPINYVQGSHFIEYNDLTEKDVIGWIQMAMGDEQVASIQTSLDNQLTNLLNPTTLVFSLPWGGV